MSEFGFDFLSLFFPTLIHSERFVASSGGGGGRGGGEGGGGVVVVVVLVCSISLH